MKRNTYFSGQHLAAFFIAIIFTFSCGGDDDDGETPDGDDGGNDFHDGDESSSDDDDDDNNDDDDDNNDDDNDTLPVEVVLDEPEDGADVSLEVTFFWHLVNATPGESYDFVVITDKGVNPCDGSGEDMWEVGDATSLTVQLDSVRYQGQTVEWAVFAIDSADNRVCSDIRSFHVL